MSMAEPTETAPALSRAGSRSVFFIDGVAAVAATAIALVVIKLNFLLFHLGAELFAVLVSLTIFVIAWNTRDANPSSLLAFVGLSMPAMAVLDLLHAIIYQGMTVVGTADANRSTQLWLAARCVQAAIFLAAPPLADRRLRTIPLLLIQAAILTVTVLGVFVFDVMPDCYVAGRGLTPFKIGAEYAVMAAAALSCLLLIRKRRLFDRRVFGFILSAVALLIPQELIFTLYDDPHGVLNGIGHLLKILSFYLIYKAIAVAALRAPYSAAFHRMRRSEDALREHLEGLESLIETRAAELRESEARWRALLECSNDWFWETDERGRFTALSPRAEESTGRGGAELLGFTHADLLDPSRPEEDFPALLDAIRRREPFRRLAFPLIAPGGAGRWCLVSGVPRFTAEGRFLGYRGTTSDITARRQAEEAARQKQTMAALGSLVGGLAHEINNLLQPVISLSDLALGRVGADAKLATYLGAIQESGLKARSILRDMLQFARVEVAESPPGDLEEAVRSAARLASSSLPARVTLTTQVTPDLEPVTVTATELTQILLNLIQNAGDAMPDGGTLRITADRVTLREAEAARRQVAEGKYIRLTVTDTGSGMDEATRRRVFDPFFTTKPLGKGTGLGLSVVYGIVRNGGGDILVESALGRGTSMIIDLPVTTPALFV